MFRIMNAVSKRENYGTLYQFVTTTIDGVISPLEIKDRTELDKKVEKMLNEEGKSKKDFIIVKVINYDIDAKNYKEIEAE